MKTLEIKTVIAISAAVALLGFGGGWYIGKRHASFPEQKEHHQTVQVSITPSVTKAGKETTDNHSEKAQPKGSNKPSPTKSSTPKTFHRSTTVKTHNLKGGFQRLEVYMNLKTVFDPQGNKVERVDLTINPTTDKYHVETGALLITSKSHPEWRLRIYPPWDSTDSVYSQMLKPVVDHQEVGKVKLGLSGGVDATVWRVAFQTPGNIFYSTNFKESGKCEVMQFSAQAPCAWLTISMSTHEYIMASLDCGSGTPTRECLDFGDRIIKTLHFYGIVR